MKRSLRFVRSQYATSWWQAVLIWLAMRYDTMSLLPGRPRPAVGEVYGEGEKGNPFILTKARVLDIRGKWIKYQTVFPDSDRPGWISFSTISDFLALYPVKEN